MCVCVWTQMMMVCARVRVREIASFWKSNLAHTPKKPSNNLPSLSLSRQLFIISKRAQTTSKHTYAATRSSAAWLPKLTLMPLPPRSALARMMLPTVRTSSLTSSKGLPGTTVLYRYESNVIFCT